MKKQPEKSKQPTINDLISFITKKDKLGKVPENFIEHKNSLKRNVLYLYEWFWNHPKFIILLNQYNDLYSQKVENDPIGFLLFLQELCYVNGIEKYMLYNNFFNFAEAMQKIKLLEDQALKNKEQLVDVVSKIKLSQMVGNEINLQKIEKPKKTSVEDKEKIKEVLQKNSEKVQEKKLNILKKNNAFLDVLNQEIIQELELTLIDTFVDDKKNQVIFIFLDKYSNKKYFIQQFKANITLSLNQTIFENDYMVQLTDENMDNYIEYEIPNYWNFQQLKRAISKNFENSLNL